MPGDKPVRKRSSKVEARERAIEVARMMARGQWYGQPSVRILADKWGIAPSTVRMYAARAWHRYLRPLDEDAGERVRRERDLTTTRQQIISAKAEAKGQFNVASAALAEVSKLNGLYAPAQVDVAGTLALTVAPAQQDLFRRAESGDAMAQRETLLWLAHTAMGDVEQLCPRLEGAERTAVVARLERLAAALRADVAEIVLALPAQE